MKAQDESKAVRQNRLRQVLAGYGKHFQNLASITLGGAVYTPATLMALIQGDIDASDASVKAKANLAATVQAEKNSQAKVDPVLRFFKAYVIAQFGDTQDVSHTLADFGYTPRKLAKKTLATKSEAMAKNQATRTLLHTAGPKQKAKVKDAANALAPAMTSSVATATPSPSPVPKSPPPAS